MKPVLPMESLWNEGEQTQRPTAHICICRGKHSWRRHLCRKTQLAEAFVKKIHMDEAFVRKIQLEEAFV